MSFVETENPELNFQAVLQQTGLAGKFNSHQIDPEHRASLQKSFADMMELTETVDFTSQVELLRSILQNDFNSSSHNQIGDAELRKPMTRSAGAGG